MTQRYDLHPLSGYNMRQTASGEFVHYSDYEELVVTLREAERRIIDLYRGINPCANTETGNRMADLDSVVQMIREAL